MSIALSTGVLIFFLASVLVCGFFLLRRGQPSLKFSLGPDEAKGFFITLLVLSAVIGLRALFTTDETVSATISNTVLFASALALPFFLRRANFSYELVGLLLFLSAVLLVFLAGSNMSLVSLMCAGLGLLVYKIIENLALEDENRFDDIIPAFIWLSGICWISLTGQSPDRSPNILLSCLSVSLLLKLIKPYFISGDKLFAKKLAKQFAFSVTGWLALLLIITRLLLLPKIASLAACYGVGIFFVCLSEDLSFAYDGLHQLSQCMRFLVALGILTLAATRSIGDMGVAILSAATLLCAPTNIAVFAGFFWLSRLLTQGFVSTYVSNVTGINLMHAYCSAAQYFGFLAMLFVAVALYLDAKKWMTPVMVLLLGVLGPPALIYLIHEEPFASFLIAANVAAIALCSFSPIIFKEHNIFKQGNLLVLPLMMSISGLLSSQLITIGNSATAASRLQLVASIAGILLVIYLLLLLVSRKKIGISRN